MIRGSSFYYWHYNLTKYCLDLLKDIGFLGAKLVNTSLDPSIKMNQDSGEPYADIITSYIRLIGKLIQLNTTRSGISIILVTQQ